jgi:membrane protein required for colicin V production
MVIDIVFISLMLLALTKGIRKGFIIAFFSFLGIFIGLAAALKLSAFTAQYLSNNTKISNTWLPFLSFILVFAIFIILMNVIGKIIEKSTDILLLGWINKLGGVLLFMLLYGLIFSVFLFYLRELRFLTPENVKASVFYPYLSPLAPDVIQSMGKIIPFFKDFFTQLENYFAKMNN